MSALPLKADITENHHCVRYVPTTDICAAADGVLFDHLVGGGEQRWWDSEAERLGRFRVDDQVELG